MISDQQIQGILNPFPPSLEDAAARLIDAANEAGGKDNVSVVLLRFHG
jgi:serine/threonine protein phosphatase PrpC